MNVKIILKFHPQQKQVNIFHQAFQYLQNLHLNAKKISVMYIEVKIEWQIL